MIWVGKNVCRWGLYGLLVLPVAAGADEAGAGVIPIHRPAQVFEELIGEYRRSFLGLPFPAGHKIEHLFELDASLISPDVAKAIARWSESHYVGPEIESLGRSGPSTDEGPSRMRLAVLKKVGQLKAKLEREDRQRLFVSLLCREGDPLVRFEAVKQVVEMGARSEGLKYVLDGLEKRVSSGVDYLDAELAIEGMYAIGIDSDRFRNAVVSRFKTLIHHPSAEVVEAVLRKWFEAIPLVDRTPFVFSFLKVRHSQAIRLAAIRLIEAYQGALVLKNPAGRIYIDRRWRAESDPFVKMALGRLLGGVIHHQTCAGVVLDGQAAVVQSYQPLH